MASVSLSYVGWVNNRKRIVWLFCFPFTSEANRPALYYQCSDADGIYAFWTLKNTKGVKNLKCTVKFPRRLYIRQPQIIEELALFKKYIFCKHAFLLIFSLLILVLMSVSIFSLLDPRKSYKPMLVISRDCLGNSFAIPFSCCDFTTGSIRVRQLMQRLGRAFIRSREVKFFRGEIDGIGYLSKVLPVGFLKTMYWKESHFWCM